MLNFGCFVAIAALLVVPDVLAANTRNVEVTQQVEATFSKGYNTIMATDLSPSCRKTVMKNLAENKAVNDDMKCDTTVEKLEDVGEIIYQALDSSTEILVDMNTIINGLPSCWTGKKFTQIFSILKCIFGQFSDIWNAAWHFIHFNRYWGDTWDKIKEFETCLKQKKEHADNAVQRALQLSQQCKTT